MNGFAERHYRSLLIAIWLLTAFLLLIAARNSIAEWRLGDPDHQMRLVQVRDLLAGQSWWDITQYRMNPPNGGPMHWSRLVDVPLAAMILFLRPFVGQATAELLTSVLVPILIYGATLAAYAALARRLFGSAVALAAALTLFAISPAVEMLAPMRIDHHGWQLVAFFVAAAAMFDKGNERRAPIVIGLAVAIWVEISMEGLPLAALFLGCLALRWLLPAYFAKLDTEQDQFPTAFTAFALGSLVCLLLTDGTLLSPNHCDSLSPVHVQVFAAMAVAVLAGSAAAKRLPSRRLQIRWASAILAALIGTAILLFQAPECSTDAFASLNPLVREYWFDRTYEGLPAWSVPLSQILPQLLVILAGLLAICFFVRSSDAMQAQDKLVLLVLFLGTALTGLTVIRTLVYAMCLAAIILAPIAIRLLLLVESRTALLPRMGLRIAAGLVLLPGLSGQLLASQMAFGSSKNTPDHAEKLFQKQAKACQVPLATIALNRLPKSQLLAPLDNSPAILQFTHHSVIATGHHRNQQAMADIILAYTGNEQQMARILKTRKVDYLIACQNSFELRFYRQKSPNGMWSLLSKGRSPRWLVRQADIGPYRIYRVDRTML